jgi:hypothetical protein
MPSAVPAQSNTQRRDDKNLPRPTSDAVDCALLQANQVDENALTSQGDTYADGLTVVIAYVAPRSPPATVEHGLTEILDNLG